MRTIVIAFEGIDGCGKTVQMRRLKKMLEARGMTVAARAYPVYTSYFGSAIGDYLSGNGGVRADEVDAKSMALWFAMDRYQDLRDYVNNQVDVLLINRYTLSNAVYQSIRERDQEDLYDWVMQLEHGELGLPEPHLYLVLDMNEANACVNVDKKGFREYIGEKKDVYEEAPDIQTRARDKYLEYAQRADNIAIIPCMRDNDLLSEVEIARLIEETLFARGVL